MAKLEEDREDDKANDNFTIANAVRSAIEAPSRYSRGKTRLIPGWQHVPAKFTPPLNREPKLFCDRCSDFTAHTYLRTESRGLISRAYTYSCECGEVRVFGNAN